ncbi:MAG: pyridoxal-phosphate dependent enzyme [Bacteroidota bacterium]|nr:pyridoxal-phosphate dependent enzyme [Bacteroidota bacterium]
MRRICRKNFLLSYSETPTAEISDASLREAGVKLLLKREDLNHSLVSGNKWWKLKYNLREAVRQGHNTLLTFGGAYSNHIYATAAAARESNFKSIGIIRGERTLPLNPTLQFALDQGMQFHYVSRGSYREKETPAFQKKLRDQFGDFYLIPEGGTNELALKGCEEFGSMLNSMAADYICLPVGTGGTMAGIVKSISPGTTVLGFAVLKDAGSLEPKIRMLIGGSVDAKWKVVTDYAYGGYAKRSDVVTKFTRTFLERTNVPLDFVYTGKMMCAIFDMIGKGFFQKGATILAIHTGGMQGHS